MPVVDKTALGQAADHRVQDRVAGLEDACLGIDIGSHRTRACIWVMSTKTPIVLENQQFFEQTMPCEFSSALYVFDDIDQDVYLLREGDPSRRCVSAKYVFYILANASDALLDQYPPARELQERKNEPEFRRQLFRGMIALLSALQAAAEAVCRENRLRIVKIGLTIPVQWGLEFEDVYRDLVMEVFETDASQVYFYTEAEALARYLYKYQAHRLDPRDRHEAILFFDFGGHNMNGCVFGVARDPDSPDGNGFFRVGRPFGAGGGSEQWEYHVGQWVSNRYYQDNKVHVPPDELEHVLKQFRRQKTRNTAERTAITCRLDKPGDMGIWKSTLTLNAINQAWREGISEPLRTAERVISRLLRSVEQGVVSMPLVVVSGGTARNPAVKSHMTTLCFSRGLPVVFTDDFDVPLVHASAQVAKAAAFVVSETLTVEQFFHRGAAIGLQMRQAPEQGKPKPKVREWDDWGRVLLDTDGQHTAIVSVRSSDEFRLICDPFFDTLPSNQRSRVLAKRTYDLIDLGKRKQGTWVFRCSLQGSGDAMRLVLQQFWSQRKDDDPEPKETLVLPLYFDGNSGSIHVGERNCDISELELHLPPQPSDLGAMET